MRKGRIIAVASVLVVPLCVLLLWGFRASPQSTDSDRKQIEHLLNHAERALDRGERRVAQEHLDEILRANPTHAMALLYRGQIARDNGDGDAARDFWQRVGKTPPKPAATARYLEGTLMLERGRARKAEQLLLESAALNPNYLQPQQRLLELYVVQARRDEVRRQIARVAEFRPLTIHEYVFRIVPPERANTPQSGSSVMKACHASDPEDLQSALALGLYLVEGERHSEAEEVLRQVFARFPRNEKAAALFAAALLRQGETAAAREALSAFSPEQTSSGALWRSYGLLAEADENWQRATECYAQVVQLEPEDSNSLYRLGVAMQHLGRSDEAQQILARAATWDRLQRQALRLVWGKRDQPALILPIIAEVGQALLDLGYAHEASKWFEQALVLNPTEPSALAGMHKSLSTIASQGTSSQADPFGPRRATESETQKQVAQDVLRESKNEEPPIKKPSNQTTFGFRDAHVEAGLGYTYYNGNTGFKHLVESMGGGIGVIDFDADGRPDFYFPQGCAIPPDLQDHSHLDRLYRNLGDGKFSDTSDKSGIIENRYGQGIAVGDFDSDGFDDIVVGNYGRNTLWHNNGDGTFRDATEAANLAEHEEMTSSLAFADLDLDGHLDLYVVNYVTSLKVCQGADGTYNSCSPTNFDAQQDRCYRNLGDGTFVDVTTTSGVIAPDGKGLGVVVADFDDDGRPDIYVANDTTPNFLFQSIGSEEGIKYLEIGLTSGVALSGEGRAQAGMGVASGDFNGDGLLDLHVTNFYQESNSLYVNLGSGLFADSIRTAGLAEPSFEMLGFGTQAGDFDLDGDLDLFVANGHIDDFRSRGEPWKMPPQAFMNDGEGRFLEVSKQSGPYFFGEYLGRGVARLDYDGDGRPDLAVVHQDRPVGLLHNETSNAGHALVLDLHGRTSNRDAVGAKIIVTTGNRVQTVQICGGDGFFSSNEKRQFIGLGKATRIDSLQIRWPSGNVDHWQDLPVDVRLVCREGLRPITQFIAQSRAIAEREAGQRQITSR